MKIGLNTVCTAIVCSSLFVVVGCGRMNNADPPRADSADQANSIEDDKNAGRPLNLGGRSASGTPSTSPAGLGHGTGRGASAVSRDSLDQATNSHEDRSPRPAFSSPAADAQFAQDRHVPQTQRDSNHKDRLAADRVDWRRVESAGLRRIDGEHLTLITDIAPSAEVDRLAAIFDLACPQWCAFFDIPTEKLVGWRIIGCLMQDAERFQNAGLLPDDLPPFLHGYARGGFLWLREQPSEYYRRHLLLHEGTHAFADAMLDPGGPAWYREGLAELLATHRLAGGELQLGWFPMRREDVPMLGRIRLVQDAVAEGRLLSIDQVLHLPFEAYVQNEPYAWSWALAAFLDRHPRYQKRFGELARQPPGDDLEKRFRAKFSSDWAQLAEEWQVFAADLEHAHNLPATVIDFLRGKPLTDGASSLSIRADAGWQNSGIRVESGRTYRVSASGRYQVVSDPQIWWCEPGGVSIRYYQGLPLGILMAGVVGGEAENPSGRSGLLDPIPIGLEREISFLIRGTLYFKINDSAGELNDNAGTLEVTIKPR